LRPAIYQIAAENLIHVEAVRRSNPEALHARERTRSAMSDKLWQVRRTCPPTLRTKSADDAAVVARRILDLRLERARRPS
jgi:hypothetical protein